MHDVLDLRDLIPDEVEQLALSGYAVDGLELEAREAARAGDLTRLAGIGDALARLERDPDWPYDEPDDDATLLEIAGRVVATTPDRARLADRIRGAWLGR